MPDPTATRLDDTVALREADSGGALLHASMAGAQLRAVATALGSGVLAPLAGLRPRAVVWVSGRSDRPREAAGVVDALAAAFGGHAVPPLVTARAVPPWVGALDVVLVSGDDAGDPGMAAVLSVAARRGAQVVADLPREGLLEEAAHPSTVWLEPLPYLPPSRGVLRHVAAGCAVLTALGAEGLDVSPAADAVDAELEGLGPDTATPVNPAKLLALSASGTDPLVWVYADPVAGAVAGRAVSAFRDAGRVTAAATVADAVRSSAERAAGSRGPADPLERLFHDEEIDGPWRSAATRHLGMVCDADADAVRRIATPLGDVEWVTDADADPAGNAPAPTSGRTLALMARLELAAAYLLVGGL